MSSSHSNALPYQEPTIGTILIQASFLLALNLLNHILDNLIFCGLIGQVLLGVAWGTPGAKWLGVETEKVVVDIGYLGLILLVYQGGLSTDFKSLKANLALSAGVAVTGIAVPICLSFVLVGLDGATPLQAFAAGAALCSTSLGTTFTVLGASGLVTTRMGVVLASAAMMDDVVGLVMVQVISELGGVTSDFSAVTIIRPVFVSVAFAVVVPVVAWLIVKPLTIIITDRWSKYPATQAKSIITSTSSAVVVHTGILLGMVAGSSYAGTSNLFAAYLAGASISWWDSEVPHLTEAKPLQSIPEPELDRDMMRRQSTPVEVPVAPVVISTETLGSETAGQAIFKQYYEVPLQRVLKPFFFASIGFSIPITSMFAGPIVWRGLIYAMLMFIGKMFCGLWLVRLPRTMATGLLPWKREPRRQEAASTPTQESKLSTGPSSDKSRMANATPPSEIEIDGWDIVQGSSSDMNMGTKIIDTTGTHKSDPRDTATNNLDPNTRTDDIEFSSLVNNRSNLSEQNQGSNSKQVPNLQAAHSIPASTPLSLYPSLIVGTAMVARGEIGFLISSVAQSNGIFSQSSALATGNDETSPLFLIVTWAIMLCTIIGPILVGLLVRRVRRLEHEAKKTGSGRGKDVLGAWGVT